MPFILKAREVASPSPPLPGIVAAPDNPATSSLTSLLMPERIRCALKRYIDGNFFIGMALLLIVVKVAFETLY